MAQQIYLIKDAKIVDKLPVIRKANTSPFSKELEEEIKKITTVTNWDYWVYSYRITGNNYCGCYNTDKCLGEIVSIFVDKDTLEVVTTDILLIKDGKIADNISKASTESRLGIYEILGIVNKRSPITDWDYLAIKYTPKNTKPYYTGFYHPNNTEFKAVSLRIDVNTYAILETEPNDYF